jgi:acetyl-CoA acetyltransferase
MPLPRTSDYYLSMGLTAEAVAKDYNISREAQDEFSYHSHQKAMAAYKTDISNPVSCLSM